MPMNRTQLENLITDPEFNPFECNELITTGQAGYFLFITLNTVNKLLQKGHINHFTIPLSRDKRIPIKDLALFMQEQGVPLTFLTNPGNDWSYTTTDTSKVIHASPQVALRLYEKGTLKGYALPSAGAGTHSGKGDRKILHSSIVDLMKEGNIPFDQLYALLINKTKNGPTTTLKPEFTLRFFNSESVQLNRVKITYEKILPFIDLHKNNIPNSLIEKYCQKYSTQVETNKDHPRFTSLREYLTQNSE